MQETQIFDEMKTILEPFIDVPALLNTVSNDTHIIDDLRVNSARLVDIMIQCEDAFNVEIDDDEADAINTVGDMVKLIKHKLN